jgi:DNA-binding response OmpR family regulator
VALRRSKRADEATAGAGSAAAPAGSLVLVVNDEHESCELLVRILRQAGHEVERARTFTEMADRLVQQPRLGCVVLDISAGGIGGNLKLLDAIRGFRDDAVSQTPVVLVTVASSSAMFSWQAGVDELVVRPFHADELVAAVHAAVTRPHAERSRYRRQQLDAVRAGGRR